MMNGMEEKVTLRLYEHPQQRACCEMVKYVPDETVRGWDYQQGDQIRLEELDGGFLMGAISHIDPVLREDHQGRYKLATLWTLD